MVCCGSTWVSGRGRVCGFPLCAPDLISRVFRPVHVALRSRDHVARGRSATTPKARDCGVRGNRISSHRMLARSLHLRVHCTIAVLVPLAVGCASRAEQFRTCVSAATQREVSGSEANSIALQLADSGGSVTRSRSSSGSYYPLSPESQATIIEKCGAFLPKSDGSEVATGTTFNRAPETTSQVVILQGPTQCVSSCWNPRADMTAIQVKSIFAPCVGQSVAFAGPISNVSSLGGADLSVYFYSRTGGIFCQVSSISADKWKTLPVGTQVKVTGTIESCTPEGRFVTLQDCELVSL